MKLLKDILYKTGIEAVNGTTHVAIEKVCSDSGKVDKFSLFVALRGTRVDGHNFIEESIQRGAVAVVCEEFPEAMQDKITYVKVKSSSAALGYIASNFMDNPSEKLKLVGVTGTNGKTTTVTLLYRLFKSLGYKTGMLSTVRIRIDNEEVEATHTTPDALQLNALLRRMVDKGCTHCFMEVSSHAAAQNRVAGVTFTGGIFTNITHDHLDYHGTFDEYIYAKKKFFDHLPDAAFALVNRDDSNAGVMLQNTHAKKRTFSLQSASDYKCKVIENQFSGMLLNIDGKEMWARLIGVFNAYNLLGVYAAADLLGEDKLSVLTTLSTLEPVEGRFQHIKTRNDITGIVDYAHTPDALKNVLKTINEIRGGSGIVITVVGCGGDRDRAKRPLMAKIACEESGKVILTSDNPRSEDPEVIISDMRKGVPSDHAKKVLAITDRMEAIKTACSLAGPGDVILVAGKGHEKYQEIKAVKHPFDDLKVLDEMLKMVC